MPEPFTATEAQTVARLRAAGCVFAEDEAVVLRSSAADAEELEQMTARRVRGEPLEQIVGWVEFAGMRILIDPGVFVPRQRTRWLVECALEEAARFTAPSILDLCCGSGAIAATIAARRPASHVLAADLDAAAVACARRNLPDATVYAGDLFDALPASHRGTLNVIAANAPYVPSDSVALMPREARDHEPRSTLDGGYDGLDIHRRIAREAPAWLAPGGALLIETSERQAAHTAALFENAGFLARIARSDDLDGTAVVGRLS